MERTGAQMKLLLDKARHHHQGEAPRSVLEVAASLLDPDEDDPTVVCTASSIEGTITWYLVILTGRSLVYVEAARKADIWTRDYGFQEEPPTSLVAWARPRRAAARIDVTSTTTRHEQVSTGLWLWSAHYVVTFDDGTTLHLPPSGERVNWDVAETIDSLVAAVIRDL